MKGRVAGRADARLRAVSFCCGIALLTTAVACRMGAPRGAVAHESGAILVYHPMRALGPLFADVQNTAVFPDSKTFVDARPLRDPSEIVAAYEAGHHAPGFNLRAFVKTNFAAPEP